MFEHYPISYLQQSKEEDGVRESLYSAIMNKDLSTVKELMMYLKNDFGTNAARLMMDQNGTLPLHLAARSGNAEIVHLLIEAYPFAAKVKDECGRLPINYTGFDGCSHVDADCVKALLETYNEGAKVQDEHGYLPIHHAVNTGDAYIIRLLIEAFPNGPRIQNASGMLPIHEAACWGNVNCLTTLLQSYAEGAKVIAHEYGWLPLHLAAKQGNVDCVIELLHAYPEGAAVRDLVNCLPIYWALQYESSTEDSDSVSTDDSNWTMNDSDADEHKHDMLPAIQLLLQVSSYTDLFKVFKG